ncbi:hypothetical protein EDF42_0742 [Curtobacterium sp. PhB172]|uniref:hypothetical protein n=1 Tax=unclassified Curtobacterium TaxID=257496 RepID=UPI000F48BF99|nr:MULTISPECIES: hypothetical protein [unclassified Curtobacterium]ROQ05081.1 hypothetical protein EDF41_3205 [Curtobacterium sp. PhB171]ROQ22282.1 hypothetical protein EDF40_3373 [Curtobacterium sp. PhB170]ROS33642.1 hypothetical protein EDF25_3028 [Curtobacterium sp. PhB131]ROS64961.1 hypothetical protein EDF30_3382 [Curtobacterium sp. PhB141]ROS69047.1 hypothetical protein EDF42_0742 [Curtobacterium sp. PhB172]
MITKMMFSVAATAALTVGLLATPTPANAAQAGTGKLNCQPSGKEVHTVSNSRGNVRHDIYGAKGHSTPWAHTNSVTMGYSSTYASWDSHHVWEYYSDGGKVFGSAMKSASVRCR